MGGDGASVAGAGSSPVVSGQFTPDQFPIDPRLHYFTLNSSDPFLGVGNHGPALQRNVLPRNSIGFDENLLASSVDINRLFAKADFGEGDVDTDIADTGFRQELEGGQRLHGFGHVWIGGSMLAMSSPNDPLFWLHHANIDRLWAEWQLDMRRNWEKANPGVQYNYKSHYYAKPAGANPIPGHEVDNRMWPWDGGEAIPATYTPGKSFAASGHPALPGITLSSQEATNLYDFFFAPFALPEGISPIDFGSIVRVEDMLDPYAAGAYYDTIAPVG